MKEKKIRKISLQGHFKLKKSEFLHICPFLYWLPCQRKFQVLKKMLGFKNRPMPEPGHLRPLQGI